MRLSFVTRTGLIVVASLTLAWIGQGALFYLAVARENRSTRPLPGQVAALVELVERAAPQERELLLRAVTSEILIARIEPGAQVGASSLRRVPRVTARELRPYLDALGGRPAAVILAPAPESRRRAAGLSFVPPVALQIRVGLATGETLVVDVRTTPVVNLFGLPVGFVVGLFGALIGLLALVVMHREARPLARLVAALGQVDLTGAGVPLSVPKGGAPEIRALLGAFNDLLGRLSQLTRARLALLGGISHDVRTFATRLRLRVEQIPETVERERAVLDIGDMVRLLDDALLASRAGAGELDEELVEFGSLVRAEVDDRRSKGEPVEFRPAPGTEEATVLGDRLALRRVVRNLLDNAVTYGRRAHVAVDLADTAVLLTVDDEGPGIPPAQRQAVLEPFVRIEVSRSRTTGGAGLGLAIVRTIVAAHQGELRIDRAPTGGARLELRLPRFRA